MNAIEKLYMLRGQWIEARANFTRACADCAVACAIEPGNTEKRTRLDTQLLAWTDAEELAYKAFKEQLEYVESLKSQKGVA